VREFVDINGKSYFIDTFGYHRDASNDQCQSMNMSMVAFDDAQEWTDVESWLINNGKITIKLRQIENYCVRRLGLFLVLDIWFAR
jgi:hypothetical protein